MDSFEPLVGITWVIGSTVTANLRCTYDAIASRSSSVPAAVGYWDTSGTASLSASAINTGVGSRGSPIEKSVRGSPASARSSARC